MILIKLTHSLTGIDVYVDFDKVKDVIFVVTDVIFVERKVHTIIWCDTQCITVKESPEQIVKLIKQAKEI